MSESTERLRASRYDPMSANCRHTGSNDFINCNDGRCACRLDDVESVLDEAENLETALKAAHTLVPTTWLDSLLSGPNALPLDKCHGKQIEGLLRAVKARIENHAIDTLSGRSETKGGNDSE